MLEELTTSIKATLYDRAKKPFTGTFALAWILINWRIVFTMFFVSEEKLGNATRIEFIESNYINWTQNLIYPILWTLILIFILPILNLLALWVKKKFEKLEFDKIMKRTPIDSDMAVNLKMEIRKIQESHSLQFQDLNENISSQRKLIKELEDDLSSKKKELEQIEIKSQAENKKQQAALHKMNDELKQNIEWKDDNVKIGKKLESNIKKYEKITEYLIKRTGGIEDSQIATLHKEVENYKLPYSKTLGEIINKTSPKG